MGKIIEKTKSIFGLSGRADETVIINGIPQAKHPKTKKEPPVVMGQNIEPEREENVQEKSGSIKRGRLPKIDGFWNFLIASGRAKRTVQEYRYEFNWWNKTAERLKKTVYTLNIAELEEILKNIHPCTVRRKISFLRSLSRWYLREGKNRLYVEVSKFVSPKIPERLPGDHGGQKFKEIRETARDLCEKKEPVGIWFGLMSMCGLRISEIQTAIIRDDVFIKVLGKGNKERLVPVPIWIIVVMHELDRDGRKGWAKGRHTIYSNIKKLGYKPHSLRHTYASELLRRGKNIEEVKVLLGHKDISTTNIYARVNISADSAELLDS